MKRENGKEKININFFAEKPSIQKRVFKKASRVIPKRLRNKIGRCSFEYQKRRARDYLQDFVETPPLFRSVLLETTTICNNDCPFCPINTKAGNREYHLMPWEIINKVLSELGKIRYQGKLQLFCNNEPLLDKRLPRIISLANQLVPESEKCIYTNGILLDIKTFKKLAEAGLDRLLINNYNDNLDFNPSVKKFLQEYRKLRGLENCKVEIRVRPKHVIRGNRGGTAPNTLRSPSPLIGYPCMRPFTQFVVNYKGEALICCIDPLWKHPVGNVLKKSILDIWQGKEFKEIRSHLINIGRHNLIPCKDCDEVGNVPVEVQQDFPIKPASRFRDTDKYPFSTIPIKIMRNLMEE